MADRPGEDELDVPEASPSSEAEATIEGGPTVVGEPVDADLGEGAHVVVVGYDAWTEPVLDELTGRGVSLSVITTDDEVAERLRDRGLTAVETQDVDEASFRAADVERAETVLVATLDDRLNVLAVLTVMNVDESVRVVTFAGEQQDVPKLRAAGADCVVSLGQAVGELLVEVALSERDVSAVVDELVGGQ